MGDAARDGNETTYEMIEGEHFRMAEVRLKTAIGRYGHTLPLLDGTVASGRVAFDWAEYETIVGVFRTMVRTNAYEVSEMALSTYLCARAHGKPMTAIPVFITRSFNHGDVVCNVNAGIESPRDLVGKRVGVRAYTVTPGVWARGILKHEHGLDLDAVTWVLGSDDHVAEFVEPPNVVSAPTGSNLGNMLLSGELDAAIGVGGLDPARVRPLIPDARAAALRFHEETGVYPISHIVVIRNDALEANPWLPRELYGLFEAARDEYESRLDSGEEPHPSDESVAPLRSTGVAEPLPFGIEANRATLETFIEWNVEQGIIPARVAVEEMFTEV